MSQEKAQLIQELRAEQFNSEYQEKRKNILEHQTEMFKVWTKTSEIQKKQAKLRVRRCPEFYEWCYCDDNSIGMGHLLSCEECSIYELCNVEHNDYLICENLDKWKLVVPKVQVITLTENFEFEYMSPKKCSECKNHNECLEFNKLNWFERQWNVRTDKDGHSVLYSTIRYNSIFY